MRHPQAGLFRLLPALTVRDKLELEPEVVELGFEVFDFVGVERDPFKPGFFLNLAEPDGDEPVIDRPARRDDKVALRNPNVIRNPVGFGAVVQGIAWRPGLDFGEYRVAVGLWWPYQAERG
jgi:hypothetical protein